jgi:hypothetical protein
MSHKFVLQDLLNQVRGTLDTAQLNNLFGGRRRRRRSADDRHEREHTHDSKSIRPISRTTQTTSPDIHHHAE